MKEPEWRSLKAKAKMDLGDAGVELLERAEEHFEELLRRRLDAVVQRVARELGLQPNLVQIESAKIAAREAVR